MPRLRMAKGWHEYSPSREALVTEDRPRWSQTAPPALPCEEALGYDPWMSAPRPCSRSRAAGAKTLVTVRSHAVRSAEDRDPGPATLPCGLKGPWHPREQGRPLPAAAPLTHTPALITSG